MAINGQPRCGLRNNVRTQTTLQNVYGTSHTRSQSRGAAAVRCLRRCALPCLLGAAVLFAGGCQAASKGKVYRYEQETQRPAQVKRAKEAYTLAMQQLAVDDTQTARVNLEAATRYDPKFGSAFNNLGWIYFHEDNMYQAAWAFQRAAELRPRDARPVSNLGLVLERGGRWKEALELHERAGRLDLRNPHYRTRADRARKQVVKNGDETPSGDRPNR